MKARLKFALGVVLIGAIAVGGYLFLQNRPLKVEVVRPSESVPIRVFGLGTVEARVLSKIGFEVPGTLTELHADHGDTVAKGTLLAKLNSAEQEARVEQAKAATMEVVE